MSSRKRSAGVAAKVAQDLMLAPMVMAIRAPLMAAEAAGWAGKSESAGAVAEKWQALADGMVAAQFAWMRGALLFPTAMIKATSAQGPVMEMASDVAIAALQPAARQVRLNHRRLSKSRKR